MNRGPIIKYIHTSLEFCLVFFFNSLVRTSFRATALEIDVTWEYEKVNRKALYKYCRNSFGFLNFRITTLYIVVAKAPIQYQQSNKN